MILLFNKKSITAAIVALSVLLMVGCSSNNANSHKSNIEDSTSSDIKPDAENDDSSSANDATKASEDNSSNNTQAKDNSQKTLIDSINKLAQQGKIINCDFSAKATILQDVEEKWGKADTSDWVSQAKGLYSTYSKHNVVFGSNKGSQIFEIRSFDSSLGQISLLNVKEVLGAPEYNTKSNGEEIIGYTAGKEFKILFVFSQSKNSSDDPILQHYSILYPNGTVNTMASDPGREW